MEEENADRYQLQHLAGGNITKLPPLFSPDANFLFVVTDKVVQVFSSSTGQTIRCLDGANHPLISLEYDLLDDNILIACTEGGELISWKWSTGRIVKQVQLKVRADVRYETFNLIKYYVNGDACCAFVTVSKRGTPMQCFIVNTVSGKPVNCPFQLKLGRQRVMVDVDKEFFKYIAVGQGPYIFFINYKNWDWKKLTNTRKVPLTCVKINPKEQVVATGDETGKITLWRQFFGPNDDVRMTLYHWHHTRVTSIAFTSSGTGFYSSGLESVLVRWNISRPDRKDFVPRMSSIILHISASQESPNLAVCTADNGIQILGVELNTKCTLQDFTYTFDDRTGNEIFPVGLKVNPRKNTLVLNGRVGHLQFYSAYSRSMLYNMDIVGLNKLSMESERILYNIRVTHAAFNIDWMATGEVFNDEQHFPEVRLKFWQYEKEIQSYSLNTNVELPHEGGLKAIEFSNPYHVENLLCATVGQDNFIKMWSLGNSGSIYKKELVWFCVGRVNYKDLPIDSISFSQDGSLLAAGFGNTLCVYKAETLKLLTTLLPNGSFDGCLHKAQMTIPNVNRNGSKKDLSTKKQKIMQLFTNLLQGNDQTFLKEIKNSVKSKKVQEKESVDETQKKLLYKHIRSMNQLNLFQKLFIYQKLGLSFQLSEEWHSKMADYIRVNVLTTKRSKELNNEVCQLNMKSRFKAKYRITKYANRKSNYEKKVNSSLIPMLNMLKLNETTKPPLTNGVGSHPEQSESNKDVLPPLQSIQSITKIVFCYGDFAHLVIACTENRVLIWNLLTLRLQTVLKLSTDHIAIDAQTNLISVFTKNQELYVFLPSVAMPLYFRANMPRVHGAVWLPRKFPKPQAIIVNWQARSTLYFLTANHEIMYLGTKDEFEEPAVAFNDDADIAATQYSTFGAYAVNKINDVQSNRATNRDVSIGVHGKAAVKSFLEMSSHTMAPLSLLCNDFLKSVIELNKSEKDKPSKPSEDDEAMDIGNDLSDKEDEDEKIKLRRNFNEKLNKLSAKNNMSTDDTLSEEHLRKISAETIEIEF